MASVGLTSMIDYRYSVFFIIKICILKLDLNIMWYGYVHMCILFVCIISFEVNFMVGKVLLNITWTVL